MSATAARIGSTPDDPMPEDFSFQLFPDDLERLEWYLNDAIARVPMLGTAGLSKVINGPIPYAPDGNPLIGPMPGVPNAFEACVFTFGICPGRRRGQGAGRMGDRGRRPNGTCGPAIRAASPALPPTRTIASPRAWRSTATNMPSSFPRHAWPAGRDQKLSPIHDRIAALGAQFNAYNGWERAIWYAQARRRHVGSRRRRPWRRDGPVGAAHPRGMPGRARCRRHSRPARLLALPPARARARATGWRR